MKKRFFAILLCLIAVMTLCVFPMTVSAEEASAETSEVVEVETPPLTSLWSKRLLLSLKLLFLKLPKIQAARVHTTRCLRASGSL